VVNLDPSVGESHGAGMRFLNFARELSAAGVHVYFAVNVFPGDDAEALRRFLQNLEATGVIAGSLLTRYSYSARQGRMGALLLYPGFTNWSLRNLQRKTVEQVIEFVKLNAINAAIVSDRRLFFIGDAIRKKLPTLLDWTDSMALHYWRALLARLRAREWSGLFGFLRDYQTNVISEFYYGRRAAINTVVSPVDKAWLDATNLKKSANRLWMNGTNTQDSVPVEKIPNRLIFSGAMDYSPNVEGALWLIDEVLPLVWRTHPDVQFVIAGVNPVPALMARANARIKVTGFVPDLGFEIARSSLYVAPLLSGGGFRNKIIEAIMKGTYVVGTPISVEFLPAHLRKLISIANNGRDMADAVVTHLDDPARCSARLDQLRSIVKSEFSWRGRTQDLVRFLGEAQAIHTRQQAGKSTAAGSEPSAG
jgi:glycosyltransferase involved in cell wall biosynthesis